MDAFETFRLLLDEYSSRILQLTSPRALNAIQLSDELGIPIAACYRRIRALKDAGILREESKVVSIGGKMVATYRSVVESAEVMLQDGRLRVQIKTDGSPERSFTDHRPAFSRLSARFEYLLDSTSFSLFCSRNLAARVLNLTAFSV
jgi:DNA-binding Lrp family transcriptional regulator